ncbi:hypothetical protein OG864_44995 [Streptomyces sp. NBC_00124]|uniref:hypothetical protein n=1 Tax=Streptomyces sp. NBC_00124 TaxID=2975662 RepID=UPI00225AF29F|nr:hypothetical protein [Streptomyces sp. NBC_00124]MCX5365859.1 hypothetical protein [Streptomyces sp. NBC_00124]
MKALCRHCGNDKCHAYEPMDFTRFEQEISGADGMGCNCDLCNQLKYAVSRHAYTLPFSQALWDALVAGTHVHVSWAEWTDKLRAERGGDDGPSCYRDRESARSYMRDGMGLGVTPGGINGALARKETS